jgi:hypothetical protein
MLRGDRRGQKSTRQIWGPKMSRDIGMCSSSYPPVIFYIAIENGTCIMYSWFTMIYLLKIVILHSYLSLSNEYYCFLSCMISISSSFIMEFAWDPHAVWLGSKTGRGPKHCFWMSQFPEELISMQPPFPNEPQGARSWHLIFRKSGSIFLNEFWTLIQKSKIVVHLDTIITS